MTPAPPVRLGLAELEPRDVPAAAFETLPVLPSDAATLDNARAIAALGHTLGRRTDAFLKFGDSNTLDPQYLYPLGNPASFAGVAAAHPELLGTLLAFQNPVDAAGENSFTRTGSVRYGGFLPILLPNVPGEIATTNAGIALVMIGTNDLGIYGNPVVFRGYLTLLVQTLTEQGVVPVLSTVPPNLQYGGAFQAKVLAFNQVIADVAAQFRVPLWNAWLTIAPLPGEGLRSDLIHLNSSPAGGGSLFPTDLGFAQNVRNLEALQVLDWYRTQVLGGPEAVPPLPNWTPLPTDRPVFAVGRDAGQGPVVEIRDAATGQVIDRFNAYDPSFAGGVRVATADVNGDGFFDIVTAAGGGGGPVVNVFSGTDGALLSHFFAFDPGFRNGFSVAAGDLDGDAKAEIVVGAGNGGGPAVAVFHGGDLTEVQSFFAFDPAFRGGVTVAVGNFAGSGPAVVAGAGAGGGSEVRLFADKTSALIGSLAALDGSYTGGVNVAAGDLNGDGFAEIVVAAADQAPAVHVFDGVSRAGVSSFFAGDVSVASGARVAVVNGTLLAAGGPGADTAAFALPGLSTTPEPLASDPGRSYGLFVG